MAQVYYKLDKRSRVSLQKREIPSKSLNSQCRIKDRFFSLKRSVYSRLSVVSKRLIMQAFSAIAIVHLMISHSKQTGEENSAIIT